MNEAGRKPIRFYGIIKLLNGTNQTCIRYSGHNFTRLLQTIHQVQVHVLFHSFPPLLPPRPHSIEPRGV